MNSEAPAKSCPLSLKFERCREHELKDFMGVNQPDFNLFKTVVEQSAFETLPCVPRTRQKPEDWEVFVETVNAILPQLGNFVDNWHIAAYFSIFRRNPVAHSRWKERRAERVTSRILSSSSSLSVQRKRIKYIGKSPPSRRLISNSAREGKIGGHGVVSFHEESHQITSIPLENYPAPCTTCGYCPPVQPSLCRKLRSFFANADDLLPVLFFIGVMHDRHLFMLLNWSPADRATFIDALNPSRVKAADKERLIELLVRGQVAGFSARAPIRSRREHPYDPIPKPPPDVERRLISANIPLSELMQAMTIQDEQEFNEILQTIDHLYGKDDYLGRDDQWWIQFFHKVYSRWPVMRLYQEAGHNNWAIKFYLRRKLAGGIQLSPNDEPAENLSYARDTTIDIDSNTSLNINASQALPYPGFTLNTCPAHPPPDYRLAGARLQHLLESHGSEELLPVFIAVGIKTDQALHSLSQLTKQDQMKFFKKDTNVRLTDLQDFALQMILNKL